MLLKFAQPITMRILKVLLPCHRPRGNKAVLRDYKGTMMGDKQPLHKAFFLARGGIWRAPLNPHDN